MFVSGKEAFTLDEEKKYIYADGASEQPENGAPEPEYLSANGVNDDAEKDGGDYFMETGELDLSDCSDEELEEIISGKITLEDYMARQAASPAEYSAEETAPVYEDVKVRTSNKKKVFVPVLALFLVCLAVGIIILILNGGEETPVFNSDEYAVAYAKNNTVHIASYLSKGVLEGGENSAIKFSRDRKVAAFSQVHESNRYKDDLYFCDIRNADEMSSGGVRIDSSVTEFHITPDGKHVIYTKAQEKQMEAYCYSVKNRSAVKLDSGIHDFYIPEDRSDCFFYTKSNGASNTVYRYNINDKKSENVLKGAGEIKFISDENGSVLFAETSSEKEGLIDLYMIEHEGDAQKILSEVLTVLYDEFVPGGNLYFLRDSDAGENGNAENYSFDSVITDDKAEADAALTEPKKDDYSVSVFGFKTYDYVSYSAAEKEYKNKLERDKIRDAIKSGIKKDSVSRGKCSCCAYDLEKKAETLVCEGVSANGIVAVNKKGAPRVVFTNYRLVANDPSELLTIDEAVAASKKFQGSLEEYLRSLVSETVIPDSLALSVNSGGKAGAEEIKDYSAETATFFFADNGNKLIALIKDEEGQKNSLASMVVNDSGISVVNPIDNNVIEVIPATKGFYYFKVDAGRENGDLFYYPDSGTTGKLLLSVVEKLVLCEDGSILAEHKPNGAIPSLSVCVNDTAKEIDKNVDIEQTVYYSKDCIAYIKNSDMGLGDLYLYNGKTAPVLIDSGVSKIFTDQP